MNIDVVGIVSVWLNLIWLIYWPLLFVPLFLCFKRKKIKRKLLYLAISIVVCFGINYIFEFIFSYVVSNLFQNSTEFILENAKLLSFTMLLLKLALSFVVINWYSKLNYFKK